MMNTHLENRQARYYTLSSRLASVDHKQLALLLGDSGPKQGWGATHTIKIDASKVFVKRIPLTEIEYDNMFSTKKKIEDINTGGLMRLDGYYVSEIVKHRNLIQSMYQFYRRLRENDRKDTPYPYIKIKRLLKETPLS